MNQQDRERVGTDGQIYRSQLGSGNRLRHQTAFGEADRWRHQHLQRAHKPAHGEALECVRIELQAIERIKE